ncbi:MAG: 4-demethylwyosine synthase TYW1, partial [Candidatus Nanoarchaeia archaeon]
MLSEDTRLELEKQKYRIVGSHSTVKVCGWTKKKIKREGSCYKEFFYGIQSEQCMQMSTSLSCANRCEFCWRGYKAPVSTEWKGEVGDPEAILEGCERAHHALLIGLKGFEGADKDIYRRSNKVKHVALSLTGEPIAYPKINDFIDLCHRK